MKKPVLLLIMSLTVLLTACGGQTTVATPTAAPNTPTPAAVVAPTVTAASTQPSGASGQPTFDPATACQPFDGRPEPVPGIPSAGPDDWVEGNPNASVTLIEYGDYQ